MSEGKNLLPVFTIFLDIKKMYTFSFLRLEIILFYAQFSEPSQLIV